MQTLEQFSIKGLLKKSVLVGALYLITESFLSHFLPVWIYSIVSMVLPWAFLVVLVLAPEHMPRLLMHIVLWSSPFWIWAASRAVIMTSPIGALIPAQDAQAVLAVVSPSGVSLLGWAYWYLMRWQQLSRTAILPIAMVYHVSAIVLCILAGVMTTTAWAWALASLVVTFGLAASMNPERKGVFGGVALFCASASTALFAML